MRKTLIAFLLITLFVISGCSSGTDKGGGSYQIMVGLNGQIWTFDSTLDESKYVSDGLITTISHETEPDQVPGNNESNYFNKGTEIFKVKSYDDLILAVEPSGDKKILQRSKN